MLLSFSVPEMLPYLRAGLLLRQGMDIGGQRVKRQTIRQRGPRANILLEQTSAGHWHPGTLHLWWKSRTKERAFIGTAIGFHLYPVTITRYTSGTVAIEGPGTSRCEWFDGRGAILKALAIADGFDTVEKFRDYFVPSPGDAFNGVMFKW